MGRYFVTLCLYNPSLYHIIVQCLRERVTRHLSTGVFHSSGILVDSRIIPECSLEWSSPECRKFWKSRVHPSTLPSIHLVQIPCDKNMITPGHCCTVLDSSLPPTIVNLFISCTNPSSNLDSHLSEGEVQAIPPKLASFSRISKQLHTGQAFMSHMVDIYTTHISLGERMRETG